MKQTPPDSSLRYRSAAARALPVGTLGVALAIASGAGSAESPVSVAKVADEQPSRPTASAHSKGEPIQRTRVTAALLGRIHYVHGRLVIASGRPLRIGLPIHVATYGGTHRIGNV